MNCRSLVLWSWYGDFESKQEPQRQEKGGRAKDSEESDERQPATGLLGRIQGAPSSKDSNEPMCIVKCAEREEDHAELGVKGELIKQGCARGRNQAQGK